MQARQDCADLAPALAVHVAPVRRSARRPGFAAVHEADLLAAHRRMPARPMGMLAPGLATRCQPRLAAPVAVPQRSTAHGIIARLRPPPSRLGTQCGEVELAYAAGGKLKRCGHEVVHWVSKNKIATEEARYIIKID